MIKLHLKLNSAAGKLNPKNYNFCNRYYNIYITNFSNEKKCLNDTLIACLFICFLR